MQAQIDEYGPLKVVEDSAVLARCLDEIYAMFPLYFCHCFYAHTRFRVSRGEAFPRYF